MTNPEQEYQRGLTAERAELERYLEYDGKKAFDRPIWSDKPKITATNVNDILDQAAPGLQWFKLALVRYHRVCDVLELDGFESIVVPSFSVGNELIDGEVIEAFKDPEVEIVRLWGEHYDQQRSMDLSRLRDLASTFRAAVSGTGTAASTEDITRTLGTVADALPEVWEGAGGSAALEHICRLHAQADLQNQRLQELAAALEALPDVLLQIVRDKANFIAGFDTPQCPVAGHAMRLSGGEDPVSHIITVAKESFFQNVGRARDEFDLSDPYADVSDVCKDWLSNQFGPAVREAFTAYVHQCGLADYYIRQAFKPVTDLVEDRDSPSFPKPDDERKRADEHTQEDEHNKEDRGDRKQQAEEPGSSSTYPSVVPAQVTPGVVTTPASVAPTAPTGSTFPQFDPIPPVSGSVGPSVSGSVGPLKQAVEQGIDRIVTTAQQGLSALIDTSSADTPSADAPFVDIPSVDPPIDEPDTPDGSKLLVDLHLPGGRLTLTQAEDGAVTATVTGPDGVAHQYTLGIKDGVPFLTSSVEQPSTAASDAANHALASGGGGEGSNGSVAKAMSDAASGGAGSVDRQVNTQAPPAVSPQPAPSTPADAHQHDGVRIDIDIDIGDRQ
ncbi:hypothetical protein [Nocardia sp. CNY236]|uniref:hypothetical protein n=1 Tax=Nocardia sp. CNY236 TaxID=1169152 RepID=UPI000420992B|nr:hypothetical protein [Nocardia sp. CNY236]